MFTVVCGVLAVLLLVVFFYYKNALNKEKEKYVFNIQEQKNSCRTQIENEKIICNNEKEVLNKKLSAIYNSIDSVMNNLNDQYKFTIELDNLKELKAKLEAVSSIIPTQVSIEELREKVNTLGNDVQNRIENKKVETNELNPISESMTNIINTMISIYTKQYCNLLDSKVIGSQTFNLPVAKEDIRCFIDDRGQCKGTFFNQNKYLKNKNEGFPTAKLEDANKVYDYTDNCIPNNSNILSDNIGGRCRPRENLFVRVSKPVELDQTNYEKTIGDLQNLRQKSLEEQQNSARQFLMLPQLLILASTQYGLERDVEKVAQYYVNGFVNFDSFGNPTIKYDELITFIRDKREKLCNRNLVQDYPVFTAELVDRVFESYMKIN